MFTELIIIAYTKQMNTNLQKILCFEVNTKKHTLLFYDSWPLVLASLFLSGVLSWDLKRLRGFYFSNSEEKTL